MEKRGEVRDEVEDDGEGVEGAGGAWYSVPSWKMVGRSPKRIVPPMCVFEISGMKTMTGCSAVGTNSDEVAPNGEDTDED